MRCELKWCESGLEATFPVNENIDDGCFRVKICDVCASALSIEKEHDLPEPDTVRSILKQYYQTHWKPVGEDLLIWLGKAAEVLGRDVAGEGFNVPCGTCKVCCNSGLNVLVTEEEAKGNKAILAEKYGGGWRIPMNGHGHCIHLTDEGCSIYERRPRTCRVFDCRQRVIANVADVHTLAMTHQWDTSEWMVSKNKMFVTAVRSAAQAFFKIYPSSGVSEISQYAVTNWHKFIGVVRRHQENEEEEHE